MAETLLDLPTPCLLLDRWRLVSNLSAMAAHATRLGVGLRPHLKTAKSIDVARLGGFESVTVSTLAEAEYFHDNGIPDILYGVGFSPDKTTRVRRLAENGCDIQVIVDSTEMTEHILDRPGSFGIWIEIDSDGWRAGLRPADPQLVEIGRRLDRAGRLRGVMTHAGGSYQAPTGDLPRWAEVERKAVTEAADVLRTAGIEVRNVSVGSTPTATFATDLTGVTEMRPGVYMFGDLDQSRLGTCTVDDIAVSVLATVIGRRHDGWVIDAGALALSLDRSVPGLGGVAGLDGTPIGDLTVDRVSQEHGVVLDPDRRLELGGRIRIYPNHACLTVAGYDHYHVVEGDLVVATWQRCRGW